MKAVCAIALSALCGMAWGHDLSGLIGTAIMIPLLWNLAKTRMIAGAGVLAFYLVTSRGIPFGAGIFFAETAPKWCAWAMWAAESMINTAPWCLLWSKSQKRRLYGLPLALLITAVPPLGIVGWTNPLMAAGVFFPGMGYVGIALFVGLLVALAARSPKVSAALFTVAAIINIATADATPDFRARETWAGIDTEFTGDNSFATLYRRINALQRIADEAQPGSVVILPESFLGDYSPASHTVLSKISEQLKQKNSTVIAGAQRPSSISGDYQIENVLLALGADEGHAIVQRVPVPFGMWKPWTNNGFKAEWLGNGLTTIHSRVVAGLICYEELLVWPVMLSMRHSPSVLVGAANDWWARDTSIPAIQRQSLKLWGRLFAVATVGATNI